MNFYRLKDGRLTDIWTQLDAPDLRCGLRQAARLGVCSGGPGS
jgi:hypothetical protein